MGLKETVGYVAAAYIVVFVLVLTYFAIMAVRVRRVERELAQLLREHSSQRQGSEGEA
jgi:CcmD family protein